MERRVRRLIVAASSVLFLTACGAQGAEDVDDPLDGETPEAAAAAAEVTIVDFGFEPAEAEVAAGETIEWTNTGDSTHTVTFQDGPDSGELETDETFNHVFDDAGEYDYVCSIHPRMQATVTVSG